MDEPFLRRSRYTVAVPLVYILFVALALLFHDMLEPYSVDYFDDPRASASSLLLGILILPGYALVKTLTFLVGGRQVCEAFEVQTYGFLGPVMGLNLLLSVGLGRYFDLRRGAQALYAFACLLGVLSLIFLCQPHFGHRMIMSWHCLFPRQMIMCIWGLFGVVYPIAAVLMMARWPADVTGLRRTLLLVSLALLPPIWLFSSLVALALFVLGPNFR